MPLILFCFIRPKSRQNATILLLVLQFAELSEISAAFACFLAMSFTEWLTSCANALYLHQRYFDNYVDLCVKENK
jgi:hypothetical protein